MKRIVMIAIIFIAVGVAGTVALGGDVFSIGPKTTVEENQSFQADEINHLRVKADVGDIVLKESEGDEIHVSITGKVPKWDADKYDISIEQKGDTLEVQFLKKKSKFFFIPLQFNVGEKRIIEVALPKDALTTGHLQSNVGDVTIDALYVDELTVKNDVGDIDIAEFNGELLTIKSNVGDTTVKEATGQVDVQLDTGEIHLTMEEITENVTLMNDVGDISVAIKGATNGVVLDADTDIGDVKIKSGSFQIGASNQNGPVLEAKTDVGDIIVEGN